MTKIMGMTLFTPNAETRTKREVSLMSSSIARLQENGNKMAKGLMTLNTNSALIDSTIADIKEADFSQHEESIEGLELEKEYKADLLKELTEVKEQALNSLKPVKEASEKIKGNMTVGLIKYQMMIRTLEIQKNMLEAGTIQVESIQKAQELGGLSTDKIEDIIKQAEDINNMTKDAIDGWNKGGADLKKQVDVNTFNVFTK